MMKFKREKSKTKEWDLKTFFHANYRTGKREFEAMFISCFGYTFWFWRTKQIYNNWPKEA